MSDSSHNLVPQQLDRSAFSVAGLTDSSDVTAYRWSKTPEERWQETERLRQLNYGDLARGRLQRVLEVVELKGG